MVPRAIQTTNQELDKRLTLNHVVRSWKRERLSDDPQLKSAGRSHPSTEDTLSPET